MKRLKRLQKLRCKKQNVKNKIFRLFWGPCGNSFLKNCLNLRKQPYWTTKLFVDEGI